MKVTFDHELQSSFYLWFDDRLTRIASGIQPDVSMTFTKYSDTSDVPTNLDAYYGPYRQLVGNGDSVPSGVYIDGVLKNQNTSTDEYLLIDFNEGRVILDPDEYGTSLSVSGDFSIKDFNVYMTNDTEEELLLDNTFIINDTDQTQLQAAQKENLNHYSVPACFVTSVTSENKPFCFGGTDTTESNLRTVVLANSNYGLDAVLSHFRDTKNLGLYMFSYDEFPYGEFFHIKSPPYSYKTMISGKLPDIWVESVRTSKLYDRNSTLRLTKGIKVGFIDFKLSVVRNPRVPS